MPMSLIVQSYKKLSLMKKLSLWGSLASIVGLGFALYPLFVTTEPATLDADIKYDGNDQSIEKNTGTVVNNQTEHQTGNNNTVIIQHVQGNVNLRPDPDSNSTIFDSGPKEKHFAGATNRPPRSVMITDKVELRQGNSIKSEPICVLWPSDRVIPLNSVFSENDVHWCQVRVASSKNCMKEGKGYVPSVILPGNCTVMSNQ